MQSDTLFILNVPFVVHKSALGKQKESFALSNAAFFLLKASLIIDAAAVAIQSDEFVDTNAAFIEHKALFCIQEDAFVLLEASCVTERATIGSREASPRGTGVALGRTAAAFVGRSCAWRLPAGPRSDRTERSTTLSSSVHLRKREGCDFV